MFYGLNLRHTSKSGLTMQTHGVICRQRNALRSLICLSERKTYCCKGYRWPAIISISMLEPKCHLSPLKPQMLNGVESAVNLSVRVNLNPKNLRLMIALAMTPEDRICIMPTQNLQTATWGLPQSRKAALCFFLCHIS